MSGRSMWAGAFSVAALIAAAACTDEAGSGPGAVDQTLAGPAPDYLVAEMSAPPASAVNGVPFTVTVTVENAGDAAAAASSTTRYFLSLDAAIGGDLAFAQTTAVPPLGVGATDVETVALSIAAGVPAASYFLIACADRGATVPESNNANNCTSSVATIAVTGPDLVVDAVSEPPALALPGASFAASDMTRNAGGAPAPTSLVAYFLSPVPARGPGARRLGSSRSAGPLAPGQSSSGSVSQRVPALGPGDYYLVACADIASAAAESDEDNNCRASAGTLTVPIADLTVSALGDPPAAIAPGQSFEVEVTTANPGNLAAPATVTRFFLSADAAPGGDLPLEGERVVSPLPAGGDSPASASLTVPSAVPLSSYHLVACADGDGSVVELSEANNCRVSAGQVMVVTPDGECGDGQQTGGEQCDDGNSEDDDGCDSDCVPTAVAQLVAGGQHNCVLLRSGSVKCWGWNPFGGLGYGNTESIGDDELPSSVGAVDVGGPVASLSAGSGYTCALLTTGAVRCWGYNFYGQLGLGHKTNIGDDELPSTVSEVNMGGAVVQLAVGGLHSCALLDTGAVRCWGRNDTGQLGYGNTRPIGDNESPASAGDVDVGGNVVQLSAASQHTCALLDTGAVRCWGQGTGGQLGYGNLNTIGDDETPASAGDVDVGGPVAAVATRGLHTCALMVSGGVRCWGVEFEGRLGYGNLDRIGDDEPPASAGDVNVGGVAVAIGATGLYTCAVLSSGAVRCWGAGMYIGYGNGLNIGDDEAPASAGDVALGGTVASLAIGGLHTCALLHSGDVRCWGNGGVGGLGYGNMDIIGDDEVPASVGPVDIF